MIPIYLCEDEPTQLAYLKKIIENFILIDALDMQVVCTANSPGTLLSRMPARPQMAVYFLDIDLKDKMNGLALAALIRRRDPRAFIIFTTTHEEMALATFRYKAEPLDYLIKGDPDYVGQVRRCLYNVLEKAGMPAGLAGDRISFRLGDQHLFLPVDDILYILGSTSHRLCIHTRDAIYQAPGTLRETAARLDDRFYLSHRSCLVHTGHILRLDKVSLQIVMDNQSCCPCSLRQYGHLQKLLQSRSS